MTQMFEDKVVVIAGAGRGLGREVAEVALREGARVVLGARSVELIEELAATLDPTGERVLAQRLDVVDRQSCADFFAGATARFGRLDAVVDIAAVDHLFGGVEDADWEAWHQVMEVNLFGAMYLVAAALPHFGAAGGAVVFVGSQSMFMAPRNVPLAGYSASKAAVVGAMRHLAVEAGPRRVRVNTVAPGWMWGPAVEGFVSTTHQNTGTPREEIVARIVDNMALPEMATDGDVAETIMFLASDRARAITGQSLLVNAGEWMQ